MSPITGKITKIVNNLGIDQTELALQNSFLEFSENDAAKSVTAGLCQKIIGAEFSQSSVNSLWLITC